MKERKNINLCTAKIKIGGKIKIFKDIVVRGNNQSELISNIKLSRLINSKITSKEKIEVISININKVVGLTNYKE